jgi:hypothetical protein
MAHDVSDLVHHVPELAAWWIAHAATIATITGGVAVGFGLERLVEELVRRVESGRMTEYKARRLYQTELKRAEKRRRKELAIGLLGLGLLYSAAFVAKAIVEGNSRRAQSRVPTLEEDPRRASQRPRLASIMCSREARSIQLTAFIHSKSLFVASHLIHRAHVLSSLTTNRSLSSRAKHQTHHIHIGRSRKRNANAGIHRPIHHPSLLHSPRLAGSPEKRKGNSTPHTIPKPLQKSNPQKLSPAKIPPFHRSITPIDQVLEGIVDSVTKAQ